MTDEAISRAARDVFVEHGPHASVSLVADRLGVTPAALFARVGSKDELLLFALAPGRPAVADRLAEAPPLGDARPALVEILGELMVFFQRVLPNLIVLRAAGHTMADLPPRNEAPPPLALRWALARWLERASEMGSLPNVRSWAMSEALLGAMEARCFNAYVGGAAFAPATDRAFVRELVDGLLGAAS